MIPKIIHYCWFGGNPLPENVKVYIDSWKKYLPEFEIKKWDETNFDVNARIYTREAYYARKFAFVSDVARLEALHEEGGLYLDTDILIKKEVPREWFEREGFVGFEHDEYVGTGIIACTPKHPIIRHFLDIYNHIHYYEGLKFSLTTNVRRFTDIMKAQGFIMNNQRQELNGFLLFHKSYFVEKTGKRVAMILTKPLCSMISKAHGGRKDGIIFGDIDSIALKQLSLGR